MGVSLGQVAAELYSVPLEEFVAQRNARAKELKGDDPGLAAEVAKLPKPLAAAHQLNAFARSHTDVLDGLLDLGSELRSAQESRDGDRVRALTKEASDAIREALRAMGGTDPAPLEQTLRAAMADEAAAAALRAGVLVKPLAPAGFGEVDLTGAVAVDTSSAPPGQRGRAKRPPSRRTDDQAAQRAAREAEQAAREKEQAEAARRAAERLERATAELGEAEDGHRLAKERVTAAQDALEQARKDERDAAKRERDGRRARDAVARTTRG